MKRLIALLLLLGLAPFSTAALVADGLVIHLDAGSLAGTLSDGDSVSSWVDQASTDTVIGTMGTVTGTGIYQPVFKTNIINGLPVVRFSGDDILCSANMNKVASGATIFAVFTGGATGQQTERMAQLGKNDAAGGKVIGLEVSTSKDGASDGGSGFRFNNGNNRMTTNNPLTTGFHVGAWQMAQGLTHSTAAYYVDNALQTFDIIAQPTNTVTLPTVNGNTILSLGAGKTSSTNWIDYYTGDLAEILVYNAVLSTAQIDEVNEYLMGKYAIPEPATLVLLGFGSLVAIRCRRA